jgi:phage tail tape measure protein, TP901 family, core region
MASNDMKRVGLIFDADGVADFKKSLSTVNAALSENRSQFKLTKSTWDENTKASEKLKATNEYLSKQYQESAKKVNVLTAELEELENAEVKDEKAISKKKAALATATVSMNNYKKGLDETTAKLKSGSAEIEEYAKKLEKTGDKASSLGKSLTKGVTAPIIATGTAAMMAWKEIDEAYDNIVAGTGATGKALEDLQNSFDVVFGSMPVDASDASTAIADLNTRFGFTEDALEDASKSFLKFSKVNKTDLSTSIALVSRAMGDAGVDSNDYAKILDSLTAASQASGISIEKLTENVTKYGAPMRALGFDIEDSIALFAQWEKSGVNTEIAFSGMKKAISNFAASGKDAKTEFRKTLEEIQKCPDIASATTKAIEVFGAKAGPDLADAIRGGRFSVEEMMKVIENSGGILEQSYNDMLSPIDKSKVAMNNLKLIGADLGESIQGALAPILESLAGILQNVAQWFKGLDDSMKTVIVVIGGIVAAIGPMLMIFGTLLGSISKIMLFFSNLSTSSMLAGTSISGLSGIFTSIIAPITAAIAIVGAIVGAIVQLWNTNDEFRSNVENAVSSIQEIMTSLWESVLSPIFAIIKDTLHDIWENGIKPLWDNWVAFIDSIITNMLLLWNDIQPILNWFIQTFGPVLVELFEFISSVFSNSVKTIMNVAGNLLSNISQCVDGIRTVLSGIIDFITGVFTGDWSKAFNGIKKIFSGIFNSLVGIAKAPLNMIIGLINGMIGGIESGINFLIGCVNKLSFDVPDWVPMIGGEKFGFNFKKMKLGRISYLAKGGTLLEGMSIIAEAGPELLMQQGNRTNVVPLTNGGGAQKHDIIDYDKMAQSFIKALKYLSINLDGDKIGELVDNRILEVI